MISDERIAVDRKVRAYITACLERDEDKKLEIWEDLASGDEIDPRDVVGHVLGTCATLSLYLMNYFGPETTEEMLQIWIQLSRDIELSIILGEADGE